MKHMPLLDERPTDGFFDRQLSALEVIRLLEKRRDCRHHLELEHFMRLMKARARQRGAHEAGSLTDPHRETPLHVCPYCLIHEDDTYFGLHVLRIDPELDPWMEKNLTLACVFCASSYRPGLYNPEVHRWRDRFDLQRVEIRGKDRGFDEGPGDKTGENAAREFELNHPDRCSERNELRRAGRFPSEAALWWMGTFHRGLPTRQEPILGLTDEQWNRIRDILPSAELISAMDREARERWNRIRDVPSSAEPEENLSDEARRLFVNAVLWKGKAAVEDWQLMPQRSGDSLKIDTQFWIWAKQGVWQRVYKVLGDKDLEWLLIDNASGR